MPWGCSVSAQTNANGLSGDSCLIRLLSTTRTLYFFPWNLGWKAEGRKRINVAYSLKAMLQPWLSRKVKRHRFSTASLRASHPCNKLTAERASSITSPTATARAAPLFRGNLRLYHEALYIISELCGGLESIWNLHKYYHRSNQRRREADLTYLFKWAAGVPGRPRAVRRAWAESAAGSITQQRCPPHPSFISFLLGQEAHLPKVNRKWKEGFLFFHAPPQEINAPDNWGFYPLALQSANTRQLDKAEYQWACGPRCLRVHWGHGGLETVSVN